MNNKIMFEMIEELNKVQGKCSARTLSEKKLIDLCMEAEEKATYLKNLSSDMNIKFEYAEGERKKGFSYECTKLNLFFSKTGKIDSFHILRQKEGYSIKRIVLSNLENCSELEKKLLRKHEGMNNYGYFNF